MLKSPIGVFDSGVGGLSVWRHLMSELPCEDMIYIADSAFCPYGPRPKEEIIERADAITRHLISCGCKLILIACNTATAAAVEVLRSRYPVDFVGMEPAVKPAALSTHTGTIAVLATKGTFKGALYNSTLKTFAGAVKVIERVGEGWVEAVERGELDTPKTRHLVKTIVEPVLEEGADKIVLGCTHYPFLIPIIEDITCGRAEILDPAPWVVNRVKSLLSQKDAFAQSEQKPHYRFETTADVNGLIAFLHSIGMGLYSNCVTKTEI